MKIEFRWLEVKRSGQRLLQFRENVSENVSTEWVTVPTTTVYELSDDCEKDV